MAKVEMYSADYCPFCLRARALLQSKGVDYTDYDVETDAKLREQMQQRGGGRTIPQIFIDDKPMGGCDDLHALDASGELDQLLTKGN